MKRSIVAKKMTELGFETLGSDIMDLGLKAVKSSDSEFVRQVGELVDFLGKTADDAHTHRSVGMNDEFINNFLKTRLKELQGKVKELLDESDPLVVWASRSAKENHSIIEILSPGQIVQFKAEKIKGIITGAIVRDGRIIYEVNYFSAGIYCLATCFEFEFTIYTENNSAGFKNKNQ